MAEETKTQSFGTWIALIGVMLPSLIVAGFTPDWNVLPTWAWIAISSVSAGIGMALANESRVAGFMGGLIGGACIPFALLYYMAWRAQWGQRFVKYELLIPFFIGAAPGFVAYYMLAWFFKTPEDEFANINDQE